MKVELRKWTMDDCARMAEICTLLDRSYLSDQLPDPYTEDSAAWWINMALEKEGKEGVFRAILADGTVVGNISVERKQDVYRQDAEIGMEPFMICAFTGNRRIGELCHKKKACKDKPSCV